MRSWTGRKGYSSEKNEQKYRRNSIEYGMSEPQVAKRAK